MPEFCFRLFPVAQIGPILSASFQVDLVGALPNLFFKRKDFRLILLVHSYRSSSQ